MAITEQNVQPEQIGEDPIVDLTAGIVSAYVSHNNISPSQLPELIGSVSSALRGQLLGPAQPEAEPQKPAVSVRSSVKPDEITCLESNPFGGISAPSTVWSQANIGQSGT